MFPSISELSLLAPGAAVSKPAAPKLSGKPPPPGAPGSGPPARKDTVEDLPARFLTDKPPARTLYLFYLFLNNF